MRIHSTRSRLSFPLRPALLALILSTALACPPPASEETVDVLETEDIGAGPTDALGSEGDAREVRGQQGPAGLVPEDFPSALPLPPSASVAGFGALSESRRYLDLDLHGQSTASVHQWLGENWGAWKRSGDRFERGSQSVAIAISELPYGSRLRIDYPARIVTGS